MEDFLTPSMSLFQSLNIARTNQAFPAVRLQIYFFVQSEKILGVADAAAHCFYTAENVMFRAFCHLGCG